MPNSSSKPREALILSYSSAADFQAGEGAGPERVRGWEASGLLDADTRSVLGFAYSRSSARFGDSWAQVCT